MLKHPYHEDYVVLPTRSNIRVDHKSIAQEARSRSQPDDASLSRWSPSSWFEHVVREACMVLSSLVHLCQHM